MSDRSHETVLEGRVVVVTDASTARAVADAGAAVVLVTPDGGGSDGDAIAATIAELEASGRRVAGFVGDLEAPAARAALAEMLSELFVGEET